jgi:putative copper resistance protein D
VDELIIASRLVHYAALAHLFGGSLFRLFIAPQHPQWRHPWPLGMLWAWRRRCSPRWAGSSARRRAWTGDWPEILKPDIVAAVLVDTRFGRLWTARLALLVALLALTSAWRRQTTAREGMMLSFSGVLTTSLAWIGHGSIGTSGLELIHITADVAHLLCATAWLGGLVWLGWYLRDALKNSDHLASFAEVRTVLPRFGRLGYVAVATLLTTGCINAMILAPDRKR